MAEAPQQRLQPGVACEECRRKRVRCDRGKPSCSACLTAGVKCVVRESCPPRGPKKGYLKTLQKKIEDLQSQLEQKQDSETSTPVEPGTMPSVPPVHGIPSLDETGSSGASSSVDHSDLHATASTTPEMTDMLPHSPIPLDSHFPMVSMDPFGCFENSFTTSPFPSLTSLNGLSELAQLPKETDLIITPMMHNDLDQLFFDRAYTFAPIVQAHRYRSWSKQPNKSQQRTCLQHAMWTLASSLSSQFAIEGQKLYAKTRQLLYALESDESYHQASLQQAQAWTMLAIYELTSQDFSRGMMSAGRAFRLVQIMRLYEVDAPGTPGSMHLEQYGNQLTLQGTLQEDWVDLETKRRTFWLAYTLDRFTCMVDGLQMFFDERLIRTRLPVPEHNYAANRPAETGFLNDMIPAVGLEWPPLDLSPFTECVLAATVCGRVLEHSQKAPGRPDQEFCRQHRALNALLSARIRMLRKYASLEYPDPILSFVALAVQISMLMLYDLVNSRPLGTDAQGMQLKQALYAEQKQQSLEAVTDVAMLISVLDQHFQMHPLTPILLLLGARFSQAHPGLNDAYNKLFPGIITMLQNTNGLKALSQHFFGLLEPTPVIEGTNRYH